MPQKKINTSRINAAICLMFISSLLSADIALADWHMPPPPVGVPGNFEQSIMNLTNWILGFVGMIAVLAFVWGGIQYLTSAGNEDQARTGKQTLKYALIGLVVAGIAYAIVNVIVNTIFA